MSRARKEKRSRGYLARLLEEAKTRQEAGTLLPGTVTHVEIRHDDHCPVLHGTGACICYPDIVFNP